MNKLLGTFEKLKKQPVPKDRLFFERNVTLLRHKLRTQFHLLFPHIQGTQTVVQRIARKAAKVVAQIVQRRQKIERRDLLILVQVDEVWWVVTPPTPTLETGARVRPSVLALLHPALPWFNNMNILSLGQSYRFVEKRIEYDVVHIAFCSALGLDEGDTPRAALERNGFSFTLLSLHPLRSDIRRVCRMA